MVSKNVFVFLVFFKTSLLDYFISEDHSSEHCLHSGIFSKSWLKIASRIDWYFLLAQISFMEVFWTFPRVVFFL